MECSDFHRPSTLYNLYCALDNVCDNAHINKVDIYKPIRFIDAHGKIRMIKTLTVDNKGNVYLKEEFDT